MVNKKYILSNFSLNGIVDFKEGDNFVGLTRFLNTFSEYISSLSENDNVIYLK